MVTMDPSSYAWDKFYADFTKQYGVTCTPTQFQRVYVWVRGHLLLGLRVDSGQVDQLIAVAFAGHMQRMV